MKSKRKEVKKYNVGGYLQAGLGTAQTLYGLSQIPAAKAEFERAQAAAPSLETPSQYYENYKNAYDSEIARMENDAIQSNLASSLQALQGAGGRALVGGLGSANQLANRQQQQMLGRERNIRLQAGQQLAAAEAATIGRKETRSQSEIAMANKGYQAALGNVGSGIGSIGTGLMYGMRGDSNPFKAAVDSEEFVGMDELNEDLNTTNNAAVVPPPPPPEVDTDAVVDMEAVTNEGLDPVTIEKQNRALNNYYTRNLDNSYFNFTKNPMPPAPVVREPEGHIESVAEEVAGRFVDKMNKHGRITGSVSKKDFNESMVGKNQFYQIFGETVVIRDMSPQQLREQAFFDGMKKIGQNTLTGFGMQQTVPFMKKQGGMMTDGEFNHDTNPIDIVQDGVKVGEATGQEVILNPKQAASIAKESSFARKLFKRFAKNAKKNK
jgi:hypothetical protein